MPIKVLPPQLANQIAAGEVVDRPAKVVKELVENSIDAAATRIDIDIERGGKKLIRIRDNGCGIKKNELALALARHATSKIATLDDLEAIVSLGFRGEALASISSVSRLTLTSRTAEQQEAWQVYAEGRDMAVTVNPAAHPVGTTLEVLDLFYNTPARRKFMRTEKTEFGHIDEIIRRIALARFDVTINLSHNGKIVRHYHREAAGGLKKNRLITICGAPFVEQAQIIEWLHGNLSLRGWVADPKAYCAAFSDIQYCYVNGRMMRNRLINQAIRQAYEDKLGADHQQPAFVLYLELDPHQVDVNVHPTKHEVRFHQSRLIHNFIYQGIMSVLQQRIEPALRLAEDCSPRNSPKPRLASSGSNQFAEPVVSWKPAVTSCTATGGSLGPSYHQANQPQLLYQKKQQALYRKLLETPIAPRKMGKIAPRIDRMKDHHQSFGRVLTVIDEDIALLERDGQQLALLALPVAERWLKQVQLTPGHHQACVKPLRVPVQLKIAQSETATVERYRSLLAEIGIEMAIEAQHVTIRAVPLPLCQQNLQKLISKLLDYLAQQTLFDTANTVQWLVRHLASEYNPWSIVQAITVLKEVERLCPQLVTMPPRGLLQHVDLRKAKNALKDE